MLRYFCCDERRQSEIARRPDLNGIKFLEVLDDASMPVKDRQRTLFVHFINDPAGLVLSAENVMIKGGEREDFRDPGVTDARVEIDSRSGSAAPLLVVEVAHPGDFSIYTLYLVPKGDSDHRLDNFDPLLRAVDFSFKVGCENEFDCTARRVCPPDLKSEPNINYLARDFSSLRQIMLDRLSMLMPDWQERSPADLGIALIELLAYVGDYLSYRQDAIATEAYLETARRRISVRRHARLVDYFMHDGCNARAWIQVAVEGGNVTIERGTQFFTSIPGLPRRIGPDSPEHSKALETNAAFFESLHQATLFPALNKMDFYTWGARECCLPKGSTRATLRGHLTNLKPGAVLILKEVRSPRTGDPDDADPRHRHPIKLVEVRPSRDPIGGRFDPSPTDTAIDITEITWAADDALPFALCISAESDDKYGAGYIEKASIALGNIVLADHGRKIEGEQLGAVPPPTLERIRRPETETSVTIGEAGRQCRQRNVETIPARFQPLLAESPLTHAAPYHEEHPPESAHAAVTWKSSDVLPVIEMRSQQEETDRIWKPQRDLLHSSAVLNEFVVETESDGRARVRFGDGRQGALPSTGEMFTAKYRIGNGVRGNVGAGTLLHVVSKHPAIKEITNPLPATGGTEMESSEHVRQNAPEAFRVQQRAVTPADYASITTSHRGVQKAAASLRWTGSWHTVFVNVDRFGSNFLDQEFISNIRDYLEPFRMAGHDLEIDHPIMVPLEMAMEVEVNPEYERSQVRSALLQILNNRYLPDGRRGIFHPDNFTFGQTVYLSPFYAAAQTVDGVKMVNITTFQRQNAPGEDGLIDGKLPMGRFEIARLDNDPNFPSRGILRLSLRGGR